MGDTLCRWLKLHGGGGLKDVRIHDGRRTLFDTSGAILNARNADDSWPVAARRLLMLSGARLPRLHAWSDATSAVRSGWARRLDC